jgi:hypothetical protein
VCGARRPLYQVLRTVSMSPNMTVLKKLGPGDGEVSQGLPMVDRTMAISLSPIPYSLSLFNLAAFHSSLSPSDTQFYPVVK